MSKKAQRSSTVSKNGVWTHRYSSDDVVHALRRVTKREAGYFRSGGRLQPHDDASEPRTRDGK